MCVCVVPVAERRAVTLGDLLHLVVVGQHEERLLEFAHFLHFSHHILVDAIHDLLRDTGRESSQRTATQVDKSYTFALANC